MTSTRRHIEEALEAQRFIASQASRERDTLLQNTLERAAELVQAGRYSEARRVCKLNIEEN